MAGQQTILAYQDPPSDVQAAVSAAIKACAGWQKTELTVMPPPPPHSTLGMPPLNEARVCSFIQSPDEIHWDVIVLLFVVSVMAGGFTLYAVAGIWRMVRWSLSLLRRGAA